MTAEILIPVALAALLVAFAFSLLLRRRPKRSARLVSAALESVPLPAADTGKSEPAPAAQREMPPEKKAQPTNPSPVVAKIAAPFSCSTPKESKPTPFKEDSFLPTLAPTPVAATSARASVPSQSPAPKFVLQSPLKSEAPSRKTKAVATSPVTAPAPAPKPEPQAPEDLAPASDKVVDITTAISVRAPQKPKISRSALPEEIRAGLAKLNQRIDHLEDAVVDLENQLEDFNLDFSQPAKTQKVASKAHAECESKVERETATKTDAVKSDRDEKTIAA